MSVSQAPVDTSTTEMHCSNSLLVEQSRQLTPPRYFAYKPFCEWLLAAFLLVPGLPLIGILVLLVRWTSPGAAIFSQRRVGRDGRVFTMYKIRSMVIDAESHTGPVWSTAGDPRITPLGYWLRKLHLDELPQLWNVLRGEMSLVGPRPERPEIADILANRIPGYGRRLAVLPGVTGLAQINLPPDSDLDSVRRKLVLDLEYANEASFLLDLRMLACTALRLVGLSGDLAMRLLLLRRMPTIPRSWYSEETSMPETAQQDQIAWTPAPVSTSGPETLVDEPSPQPITALRSLS